MQTLSPFSCSFNGLWWWGKWCILCFEFIYFKWFYLWNHILKVSPGNMFSKHLPKLWCLRVYSLWYLFGNIWEYHKYSTHYSSITDEANTSYPTVPKGHLEVLKLICHVPLLSCSTRGFPIGTIIALMIRVEEILKNQVCLVLPTKQGGELSLIFHSGLIFIIHLEKKP